MTSKIILQPHQIIKLEEKLTQQEIADIFGVNVKTIQRWKYLTNLPKQKRGKKEIFNQEKLDILCSYTITIKIITKKSLAQSNFFFLDECSFHLNHAPRRGYYWKTSRLVSQRPGDKGKNQSLILLTQITKGEKIIHQRMVEGGVSGEVFHNFLTDFNPPNNGKKNYLIMDNLSVHKAIRGGINILIHFIVLSRHQGQCSEVGTSECWTKGGGYCDVPGLFAAKNRWNKQSLIVSLP